MIDNKELILQEIAQHKDREIARLTQEHNEKLEQSKKDASEKVKVLLKEQEENHQKELARLEKQHTNSADLTTEQNILSSQNHVYQRVVEALLKDAMKEKALFSRFAKELKKEAGNISHFSVPKGCGLSGKGFKAELDEPKVVGVISKHEEVEKSVNDLIRQHNKEIHDIIAKELF